MLDEPSFVAWPFLCRRCFIVQGHRNDVGRTMLADLRARAALVYWCKCLLVSNGLIRFMRCSSRQGSSSFPTLFATFEEHLRYTSSVRQVVPPEFSQFKPMITDT